jgi:ATP-dependent exoDNAse (exonuclease V) alpha subunit
MVEDLTETEYQEQYKSIRQGCKQKQAMSRITIGSGFREGQVALAYATTVHKSQGSEYPAVVIPLATQHYPMLARNLLYTGVTRGKRLVVLIGQPKACALAVRNVRAMRRLTNLAARLRQQSASE